MVHPRHRGDCADFFATLQQPKRIDLDGPHSAINKLERAAAQAGRTWNDQLIYIFGLFLGYHLPDFDDGRSLEDWRTFMSPWKFRVSETEGWSPFTCLWKQKGQ
jgi:hypothetical protein